MHSRRRRSDDDRPPDERDEGDAAASEPELLDSGTVSALREADPHTRARTLIRLQRLHGNAAVQRVIRSLQATDATRDARVQAIGERAAEVVPSDRLEKAALYREAVAAELDASPAASKTERELVQDNVNTVGQIFSNYQAALHLFEEAVVGGYGETVPRSLALEVLQLAAREVFEPVLDACVGVAPGLEALAAEGMGKVEGAREFERPEAGQSAPAHTLRNLVIAERQRLAVSHSRLIRRQVTMMKAAETRAAVDGGDYRAALIAAAARLDELETGSHSAGALFKALFNRWRDLLRTRTRTSIMLDADWKVQRAHIEGPEARRLAADLLAGAGGLFDLNRLHVPRHVVWHPAEHAVCEAFVDTEGRLRQLERNEKGGPFAAEFERRLRTDGLPRTKVLTGE
ncbi:MAG TPA: hypothetical protein VNO82_09305 [Solirubrobacteraceae bacterium]|nr:hypothetical protein [Solirubrobacteraceae bacterium]